MINPKGLNIDKSFTVSGIKEIGSYTYVLMIDFAGLTLIKRIIDDESEIKYAKRTTETIDNFWADPTAHTYEYINKL